MREKMEHPSSYSPAAGQVQKKTVIHTSSVGLVSGYAEIETSDRNIPGYFAYPEDRKDSPLLLVLSEAFGLHEFVLDVVRRFAYEGYYAVAPDLMVRQGDPSRSADLSALLTDVLLKIPDDQVMRDIDSTRTWAVRQGASTDRTAITGFCWGGRWVWLYCATRQLNAAVVWYGILDGKRSDVFKNLLSNYPKHPIDIVDALQTPVLGLYGGSDEAIPLDSIHDMQQALKEGSEAARQSEIVVYPEAGHAFFADYRDLYRPDAAKDAWMRCIRWLKR